MKRKKTVIKPGTKPLFLFIFAIPLLLSGCKKQTEPFGIIFTNSYEDIFRIHDITTGEIEQLTFTPLIGEYYLIPFQNGEKIIFEAGLSGIEVIPEERQQHIYLLDANNKEFSNITNILVDYEMVWHYFSMDLSTDEKQYVFVNHDISGYEGNSFLEIVDRDGKNREIILIETTGNIPAYIQSVLWSPDQQKFILTQGVIGVDNQYNYPGSAILLYDATKEEVIEITSHEDHCYPDEWSPNSESIVITCSYPFSLKEHVSGLSQVKIINLANNYQILPVYSNTPCEYPSWSPDGKHILMVCGKDVNRNGLFIVNANAKNMHEIQLRTLENQIIMGQPLWSPDGSQIVYVAGSDALDKKIYIVNIDGANNHAITADEGTYILHAVYRIGSN